MTRSQTIRPDPERPGRDRKREHIDLALEKRMQVDHRHFHDYRFDHVALPEIARDDVDVSTEFLGKHLQAPLLVSCMTGGTELAARINRNLAIAAEETQVPLGVGSQRKAIEDSAQAETFQVRDVAPTIPLLANLGAVQLNYGYGVDECRRTVEMIDADALVLHLNPLQEAIQPEGQTDFSDLAEKIERLVPALDVPVIVKEVGAGISARVARTLREAGVSIVDTAGVGGTSWARIEAARAEDLEIGELFADWGIPTPESILQVASVEGLFVIGSGGVRSGIDVAKAIALGAGLVGMAAPFLEAAVESSEAVASRLGRTIEELKTAMFCLGVENLAELRTVAIEKREPA